MPLSDRINPLIALSGDKQDVVGTTLGHMNQVQKNKLLGAETELRQAQTTGLQDQNEAMANFKGVLQGVQEFAPMLNEILAAGTGTDFQGRPVASGSVDNFINGLEQRRTQLIEEGKLTAETDGIIDLARKGDFEEIRRSFDDVLSTADEIQRRQLTGRATPISTGILDRADLIGGFSEEDQVQARRVEAGLEPRAGTVSATERIADPDTDLTEQVADSQGTIAGAVETSRQEAITATIPEQERARQEQIAKTTRIKEQSTRRETAIAALPDAEFKIAEYSNLIQEVVNSPHLEAVVGFVQGRVEGLTGEQRAVLNKLEQLQGGAFLDAFQSLKGGGPITDTEGRAATAAKTRILDRTVDLPSYIDALNDLDASFINGLAKIRNESSIDIDGDTATGVNGEKWIFRDGEWVQQ